MEYNSDNRRLLNIINNAITNEEVNRLFELYNLELQSKLVKKDDDLDIYLDTYLKLTLTYNPNKDFKLLYIKTFYLLKRLYRLDKASSPIQYIANYYDNVIEDDIEEELQSTKYNLDDLLKKILEFNLNTKVNNAISKESTTNKDKKI